MRIKVPVSDNVTNRLVRLEGAVGRVFIKAMDWAEEDFRREIEEMKWGWPQETKRRNKTTAGLRRDIVDLGGLRDSQKKRERRRKYYDFYLDWRRRQFLCFRGS